MIRRPPRSTQSRSSAASDVYKRQVLEQILGVVLHPAGGRIVLPQVPPGGGGRRQRRRAERDRARGRGALVKRQHEVAFWLSHGLRLPGASFAGNDRRAKSDGAQ